jgi:ankyrin repeat protein/L-ascorbate metabolism protein UlaG (beta-lactamase superfamily)
MKKMAFFAFALVFLMICAVYVSGNQEFIKILDSNDTEKIMKMLSDSPQLLKQDLGLGMIALHYAAYYGNNTVLDYILKNGVELNHKDNRGRPAVYFAVSGGQPEMVKKLIALGADLNYKNEMDESLLFRAGIVGNQDTIKLLVEHGLDINHKNKYEQTPILMAVQGGNVEVLKYFKSKGVDLKQKAGGDMSLLHLAVFSRKADPINYLLDEGLDINATGENGETPLLLAVSFGAKDPAKALVERGADVNLANTSGVTPFLYAVKRGEKELVDLFIKNKANVNTVDKNTGRTVLHEAAARGYSAIVDLLLKNGADKDAKDKNGYTALSYALKYGNQEAAEILKKAKVEDFKWETNLGYSEYLSKPMNDGEAYIWYLKHSGWAVKTKNALLIFDYWDDAPSPDVKLLANGHINVEEIKNLPVYVFVSHSHGDHFDKQIFEWKKTIPNIKYIFGFKNDETDGTIFAEPRSQQKIDNLIVTTIKSNDDGVGFVVQLDGLTLFHAGDHSNNTLEEPNDFFPEIDYLAEKGIKADVAFYLNMYGCGSTNPEAFEKGIFYAIDKLKTKAVFPMHASYKEWVYQNLADDVAKNKKDVKVGVASISGDRFFYSEGTLK